MQEAGAGTCIRGVAVIACMLGACDTSTDLPSDAGNPSQGRGAGRDDAMVANPRDAAPPSQRDAMPPVVVFPPPQLPDSVCALAVGAECDGAEDCGSGQVCCGEFDPATFSYERIACADRCDGSNSFEFCHEGERCGTSGLVCRRSLIIPYDFVGVCAMPAEPARDLRGEAVSGQIACGAQTCDVGAEKCCLRARFDFARRAAMALEPHCAPIDYQCACDAAPEPQDAGSESEHDDEDAG